MASSVWASTRNDIKKKPHRLVSAIENRYRSDRWRRMQAGIFLLSSTGWSVVQELVVNLAAQLDISPSSGSLQRLYRLYLKEAGLVHYEVLPFFQSGLGVVRLTAAGKKVCLQYGYPRIRVRLGTVDSTACR